MAVLQYISQAYRFLPVCLFILCLPCAVSAGEEQDSYRMQLIEKIPPDRHRPRARLAGPAALSR